MHGDESRGHWILAEEVPQEPQNSSENPKKPTKTGVWKQYTRQSIPRGDPCLVKGGQHGKKHSLPFSECAWQEQCVGYRVLPLRLAPASEPEVRCLGTEKKGVSSPATSTVCQLCFAFVSPFSVFPAECAMSQSLSPACGFWSSHCLQCKR